jgi:hypothetical protein
LKFLPTVARSKMFISSTVLATSATSQLAQHAWPFLHEKQMPILARSKILTFASLLVSPGSRLLFKAITISTTLTFPSWFRSVVNGWAETGEIEMTEIRNNDIKNKCTCLVLSPSIDTPENLMHNIGIIIL